MVKKEAWYRELEAADTAISAPDPAERPESKDKSYLPGDAEMPPEPFRKHPKKLV